MLVSGFGAIVYFLINLLCVKVKYMPVEKLTKKRLIQLLITLAILLGFFSYRTYVHIKSQQTVSIYSTVDEKVV